jgi:hypothetical protein
MEAKQAGEPFQDLEGIVDDEHMMMAMRPHPGPHESEIAIRRRASLQAKLRA